MQWRGSPWGEAEMFVLNIARRAPWGATKFTSIKTKL